MIGQVRKENGLSSRRIGENGARRREKVGRTRREQKTDPEIENKIRNKKREDVRKRKQ